MFRYGGPIKEGVMSGIREPQAKHTVGSSIWPKTDGRTHQSKIGTGGKIISKVPGGSKIVSKISSSTKDLFPRIGQWWQRIKPTYRTQPGKVTQNKTIIGNKPDGTPIYGYSGAADKYIKQTMPRVPIKDKVAAFARENPWWTYGGGAAGMTSGAIPATVGGIASLAEKIPLQVADLLVKDEYFDQDKWMKENFPDGFIGSLFSGKDKKEDEKELTADELRIKQLEKLIASKEEPTVPQKSDAEIREEQIQKYRDIMDIKGMNKEAAYDSLIAASQAINQSQDFKGDLKSGNLINQIIQGASKAFDKPKKTKDAIDTLILKGEIEKDLNKDKNAIMDEYRMKQIQLADKQLNESLTEKAIKFAGTMKKPYVDQETAIMTIRDQFDVTPNIVLSEKDMEEIKKQDDYTNETDVFTKIVDKQKLGPGYYVMGSSGFILDEGDNIKQIL